jgi:hypothetical protein
LLLCAGISLGRAIGLGAAHDELAAHEGLVVKHFHRAFGVFGGAHDHEAIAFRAMGIAVVDHFDAFDGPDAFEEILKFIFGSFVGEVPEVEAARIDWRITLGGAFAWFFTGVTFFAWAALSTLATISTLVTIAAISAFATIATISAFAAVATISAFTAVATISAFATVATTSSGGGRRLGHPAWAGVFTGLGKSDCFEDFLPDGQSRGLFCATLGVASLVLSLALPPPVAIAVTVAIVSALAVAITISAFTVTITVTITVTAFAVATTVSILATTGAASASWLTALTWIALFV